MPAVSVLMTAYNREAFIVEAIESVLASDFTDFELIIVDDASTDNTVAIANKYVAIDSRVIVFVNQQNLGQFANRNLAASYARGKYLKYLDSDDKINRDGLNVMISSMEKFPEAGLGFCHTIGVSTFSYPYLIDCTDAYKKHFFSGGLLFTGPSGVIIRKDAFIAAGCFEEFGMPSDNHLSLKIAGKFPVVAILPDIFYWREHEGQVFNMNKKNYYNIADNYLYIRDLIKHHSPLNNVDNKKILFNQKKIFFINVCKVAFKKGRLSAAIKLLGKFRATGFF